MKLFISDLHLGDLSRTDDFHRDTEFLRFLDFAEDNASELIILGDLFELWQSDLERIVFARDRLINRLFSLRNKLRLTYVIGNHDYIPFIKLTDLNLGIRTEYKDNENSIIAEHGHNYDIFNRYKRPLRSIKWPTGKRLSLVVAYLERLLHPDSDEWLSRRLENIDSFLHHASIIQNKIPPSSGEYIQRGGHFGEFANAALKHIEEGKRIVIFGHTHKLQLTKLGNGIYANCGAWTDAVEPTYIAYDKGKIELRNGITHKVIEALVV